MNRLALVALAGATATSTLGACSTEDLAEKVAEEAVEQQLEEDGQTGDVDLDIDDGEIRIETPDGSIVMNEDGNGNVSIQGEGSDGDVAIDMQEGGETIVSTPDGVFSSTGELPADFPSTIPLPEGLAVASSSSMSDDDSGTIFSVNGTVDGGIADVTDAYVAALEAAGFTKQSITTSPDGTIIGYVSDEWTVSGGIFVDPNGGEDAQVGLTIFPST